MNQTPVAARLLITEMPDDGCRGGMLVAKATFELSASSPALVTSDPVPVPTPYEDMGDLPPATAR